MGKFRHLRAWVWLKLDRQGETLEGAGCKKTRGQPESALQTEASDKLLDFTMGHLRFQETHKGVDHVQAIKHIAFGGLKTLHSLGFITAT